MRGILFAAAVATAAGSLLCAQADAAPRGAMSLTQTAGTGTHLAREAGEAPRGRDGARDRKERGASNTAPESAPAMFARERGEAPRGEGRGHP